MDNYNYIKVMQQIDAILPPTNNRNYRETKTNDLWEDILSLLETLGLDKEPEVEELEETIWKNQRDNERIQTMPNINPESIAKTYDPNLLHVKTRIERMKTSLQEFIIKKMFPNHLISDSKGGNPNRLGTDEEILAYASKENIRDYIKNLLAITKMDKSDNDFHYFEYSLFTKDIMYHYGIDMENGTTYTEITNLIKSIITKDSIIENHYIEGQNKMPKLNLDEINPEVMAIIEKITNIVYDILQQYVMNNPNVNERPNYKDSENNPKVVEKNIQDEPAKEVDVDDNIDEIQIGQLDDMITKHQKLLELMQTNREIAIQIKETTQKLAQLKAEYAKNNEIIKSTSHHV